jgi:hypothetical protein
MLAIGPVLVGPIIASAQQIPVQVSRAKGLLIPVYGGVRHTTIPESLWGSWAPSNDLCTSIQKSVFVLSASSYVTPQADCAVSWVVETAGPSGPIYSAHIQCTKRGLKAQKTTSDLLIVPRNTDRISLGYEFDRLKTYRRCSTDKAAPTQ